MKILLTGATGYIGKRLLPHLLEAGHTVVCLVRDPRRVQGKYSENENVTLIKADLLDEKSLEKIPVDIDIAYYFVHSMGASSESFAELRRETQQKIL